MATAVSDTDTELRITRLEGRGIAYNIHCRLEGRARGWIVGRIVGWKWEGERRR